MSKDELLPIGTDVFALIKGKVCGHHVDGTRMAYEIETHDAVYAIWTEDITKYDPEQLRRQQAKASKTTTKG